MQRKLTITLDEEIYEGLHKVIGRRKISQFIEDLVRPHVTTSELEAGYAAMAADEEWEFEGRKSRFSDRFSGYSVFVSRSNPDFRTSLSFAELIAKEMKAQGLEYAQQYSQAIMGRYQRPLLNKETGVYRYDELIVLRKTRMAAVLLEAGSIINRDEELKMSSPERRDIISSGVTAALKEFCEPRWAMLGPL